MDYNEELVREIVLKNDHSVVYEYMTEENREDLLMSFSNLALNLTESMEIDSKDKVLVVGDKYGNITNYLALKNRSVTVLKLNSEKEMVTVRCLKRDNVVFVDEILDDEKFDAIFIFHPKLHEKYLELVNHLKKNGKLMYSFDNTNESNIRKKINLINHSLENCFLYYPYPDSNFTMALVEDVFLNKVDDMQMPFFDEELFLLYDTDKIIGCPMKELSSKGKNCVLTVDRCQTGSHLIYVKFSNERRTRYRIKTVEYIDEKNQIVVRKIPLSESAETHLRLMNWAEIFFNERFQQKRIRMAHSWIKKDGIEFEFVEGKSLVSVLEDSLMKNEDMFVEQIMDFFGELDILQDGYFVKTREFVECFGNPDLSPDLKASSINNIDLIFQNTILQNSEYVIIDYEWVFKFPIPINYIKWRSIFYFFQEHEIDNDRQESNTLFACLKEKIGITDDEEKCYLNMEEQFQRYIYDK